MTANETHLAAPAADLIGALRATGRTARQIAVAVGVHVSTVYRWARGIFRPSITRAAALAALAAKENHVTAPINVNTINGSPVVAATADVITAALNGRQALTITGKHATGDTVWATSIAREMEHPQFGKVLYAYINMDRVEAAPQLVALDKARNARAFAASLDAERAGAALVPSCNNCGDCAKCC